MIKQWLPLPDHDSIFFFITADLIKQWLPLPDKDITVFIIADMIKNSGSLYLIMIVLFLLQMT